MSGYGEARPQKRKRPATTAFAGGHRALQGAERLASYYIHQLALRAERAYSMSGTAASECEGHQQ